MRMEHFLRGTDKTVTPLKTVEKLVSAWKDGWHYRKFGNHSFFIIDDKVEFRYFGNPIIVIQGERFTVDWCGYDDSRSTTRAINSYRTVLEKLGYREKKSVYLTLNKTGTCLVKEVWRNGRVVSGGGIYHGREK